MTLSIIYINYNTGKLLKQSLKHLFLIAPALDFEVIVIDNNSTDGSAEMINKYYPAVKLIQSEKNLGYAKGANLGIKNSIGSYVAIFNPDIFIMPGSLETIVNYLDNNLSTHAVGPQLVNTDKTLQYSCYRFPRIYTPVMRRTFLGKTKIGQTELNRYLMKDFSHSENMAVDWLLGGAIIARRSALDAVGLFDERYFLYFEDTDLGKKFQAHGFKLVYLPSAKMVHLHRRESADTPLFKSIFNKTMRAHIRSAIKYFLKW